MPKRVKVKVIGSGTEDDPYRVDLPNWELEVVDLKPQIDYKARIAWVLIPDDEVDEEGRINEKRIREKYPGRWKRFRREDVEA